MLFTVNQGIYRACDPS